MDQFKVKSPKLWKKMLFRGRETRSLFPVTNYRRIISHRYTQPSQSHQNWPRNDTRDNTGPRTLFSRTSHFPDWCSDSSDTWWPRNAIQSTDRSWGSRIRRKRIRDANADRAGPEEPIFPLLESRTDWRQETLLVWSCACSAHTLPTLLGIWAEISECVDIEGNTSINLSISVRVSILVRMPRL